MRRLLPILLAILAPLSFGTITTAQKKCTGTTTTDACTISTCALSSLTAIGAGHTLVALLVKDGGTASTFTISSITTETWTHCASGCSRTSSAQGTDASYVLSATGGETTFTMTLSGTTTGWNWCLYEYSTTTASLSLDGTPCNAAIASAAPTACNPTSPTGSSDVLVSEIIWGGSLTGATSPGADFIESNGNGTADKINVSTITGVAFTPTTSNSGISMSIAFKEAAGGAAPVCTIALMGAGPC